MECNYANRLDSMHIAGKQNYSIHGLTYQNLVSGYTAQVFKV